MLSTVEIGSIMVVSLMWGGTNPLLRIGSRSASARSQSSTSSSSSSSGGASRLLRPFLEMWALLKDWRFSIPLMINQMASVLFIVLLASLPLTVVVPVVNSLTFLVTAVVGFLLGEPTASFRLWLGTYCILIGIGICLYTS
uniref:Transmembrane protein 234 n=1 Tax=Plectus sambesii TaxID=2011161 RepID=A0A914WXW9_9BILA